MGIDKNETAIAELRRHAEEQLLAKTTQLPPPRTGEEMQRLVHELEVHQIELEMQNTGLRQARNELETALDKYRDLYDFAPISYFTLDSDGTISAVNLAGASIFGIERARLLGRRFGRFVADEARSLFSDFLGKVFARQGKESCEVTLTNGGNHPLFVQIEAVADAAGKECRIAVINITERKQFEKKLRTSERLLAEAQSIAHIGSWEWDRIADKITGSDEFNRIFGLTLSSYDSFQELVHSDDREMLNKAVAETLAHQSPYNVHYRIIRPDGVTRVIHAQGVAQTDGNGKTVRMVGVAHDITGRRRAEDLLAKEKLKVEELNRSLETRIVQAVEELRQKDQMLTMQDRLAIMGEMINNIAHQWRQPLNTLGLIIQNVQISYDTDEFSREFIDENTSEAMELIQHMSRTIDDFRNFFKPDKEIVAFSINEVIARAHALIEKSFAELKIGITLHHEGDPTANGHPNEYTQVLLNILMNARDALVERNVDNALISISAFAEGGQAVVTITDNAGGIPDEIKGKLFDPYFTTKGPDKGTGIGLFMSKTIIEKSMGGRLTVRNTGNGAEFRIEM